VIDVLTVPPFERLELIGLARREAPREACALALITSRPGSPGGTVVGVVPIENIAEEPEESFAFGEAGLALAAVLRGQRLGVVFFHSHTRGPAHLSSGDLRFGRPGDQHLVYSVELDELRAFVLEPGGELDRRRVRAVEIAVV